MSGSAGDRVSLHKYDDACYGYEEQGRQQPTDHSGLFSKMKERLI